MIKLAITVFSVFFLPACAAVEKVMDPVLIYKRGMTEGSKAMVEEVRNSLEQKGAYGYVQPYHPVRFPADVRRVWIVDHPNEAGDLIQGHWVFMVVKPGRWATPSIPAVHPQSGTRMPEKIPVIEEKLAHSPSGRQGSRDASQGE